MQADTLNQLVHAHYMCIVSAQVAHWNMAGPHFSELHELTDQIYEAFAEKLDDMVEQFISHEDEQVILSFPSEVTVSGTPHECLEFVKRAVLSYQDLLTEEIYSEDECSEEDLDTLIDLSHFVAHYLWQLNRNLI